MYFEPFILIYKFSNQNFFKQASYKWEDYQSIEFLY